MQKGLVLTIPRNARRLETFLDANRRSGLELVPYFGVEPHMFTRDELVAQGLIHENLNPRFRPGYIAHALSCRSIWIEAAQAAGPTYVFEDDAYLADDLPAKVDQATAGLSDWDIVLLGYNTDSILDILLSDEMRLMSKFSIKNPTPDQIQAIIQQPNPRVFRLHQAFATCGYVISPRGARACLEACFPLRNVVVKVPALGRPLLTYTLDCTLNTVYRSLHAYAFMPPLVLTSNDPASSSIT
ncbi:MAG: glycosyltransferase family 25 protein [Rubrivivax sp.]|nr:glycosyltransferase family 25 protein [Rubrivivax sp.]